MSFYGTIGGSMPIVLSDHPLEDWKVASRPTSGFLSHSKSGVGLSTASTAEPSPRIINSEQQPVVPNGTLFECPPSPGLTRRLLASAQARKRAGRHCLVGSSVLRLSVAPSIDRWAIPDDVYSALTAKASAAKKAGQHKLVRRRIGLSGEVQPVLVLEESLLLARHISTTSTASVYSPDPSAEVNYA